MCEAVFEIRSGAAILMSDHKRKWLQFSTRTFLLIVTLLAVWLAASIRQAKNQKTAVTTIKSLGGRVRYDFEPTLRERLRREEEQRKAFAAGKIPPTYIDGPMVPKWLADRMGIDFFARVRMVDLSRTLCTDNDLEILQLIPNLKELYLRGVPYVTSDGIANLSGIRLETLSLDGNQYSDEVGETGLNDRALVHVGKLRTLKDLSIEQNRFTDDGLKHISNLTRLESLSLTGTDITAGGLDQIANLRYLRTLQLPNFPIDDDVLRRLSRLVEMQNDLGPIDESVTDAGLAYLRDFRNLESLSLRGTQISDDGMKALANLVNLRFLDLSRTAIGDRGIQHITRLGKLEYINLDKTLVTDESASVVRTWTNLTHVSSNETDVGDTWAARLSELKNLEYTGLNRTRVTDIGLASFRKSPALKALNLSGSAVTVQGVDDLRTSLPTCRIMHSP